MSKAKNKREKVRGKLQPQSQSDAGRRKFLTLGLGGLGTLAIAGFAGYKSGWFDSAPAPALAPVSSTPSPATGKTLLAVSLQADYQNALRAGEEFVTFYARELNNPSALIHAVRAFGKNFTLNDGTKAVDFICSKYAAEKEINGKRYVYFAREAEVHDNSFLKTFLEAGVSLDQTVIAGSNKYTLRDVGESAKALFRCDPQNFQRYDPTFLYQHLPWSLIAFSILVPQAQSTWVNAFGETINLPQVIDRALASFESTCAGVRDAIAHGEDESVQFRQEMTQYSCFGMHTVYGFFSCLNHGYRDNKMEERLREVFDSVIYRLQGDARAINRESEAARQYGQEYIKRMEGQLNAKGSPPPQIVEVMRLRHLNRMLGHGLEAINYAQLHRLFTLTTEQKRLLKAGEQMLYENLVQIRATDMVPFMSWYSKFISDIVISFGHAVRAMKLLTPKNPDTFA